MIWDHRCEKHFETASWWVFPTGNGIQPEIVKSSPCPMPPVLDVFRALLHAHDHPRPSQSSGTGDGRDIGAPRKRRDVELERSRLRFSPFLSDSAGFWAVWFGVWGVWWVVGSACGRPSSSPIHPQRSSAFQVRNLQKGAHISHRVVCRENSCSTKRQCGVSREKCNANR